jgi:predicted metal-dependent HD superfamily phosphohydrolase
LSPNTEDITAIDRFQSLWKRNLCATATDDSEAIYHRLLAGYQEPHRHYHTLDHIKHCLTLFEDCKALVSEPDAVELAIWFHDVVLVSGRRDNEARSAQLYLELSDGIQRESLRQLVWRLIMATLHNGEHLDDADSNYMVDIDLSSFGQPWDEFMHDSMNVRTESRHLCDADYQLKQTGFQRSLLARSRFYLSDFFFERLENQARDNLARYFEHLHSDSDNAATDLPATDRPTKDR